MPRLSREDLDALYADLTVDIPCAGRLLGIKSRNAAYKACEAGDIPSIKTGNMRRAPTAKLKELLGLPQELPSPQIAA